MKKKQKDKSRYLFYVIAVGVLILFLLMVISSLLNIGEKLRRISEYLEYGFYALVVLLFYFVLLRLISIDTFVYQFILISRFRRKYDFICLQIVSYWCFVNSIE